MCPSPSLESPLSPMGESPLYVWGVPETFSETHRVRLIYLLVMNVQRNHHLHIVLKQLL